MVLALRWPFLWNLPDYTRFLAPAMLATLLHDTMTSISNHWTFLLVFGGLAGWKWYSSQRDQQRRGLIGMPIVVVSHVNLSDPTLDESQWSKWSRSQVLTWIASLDEHDWRTSVCSLLAPEGITGAVLRNMTTEDLRSMGVCYGDARRLVDQIQVLVSKYPARNYRPALESAIDDTTTSGRDMVDEWLGYERPQQWSSRSEPQPSPSKEIEGFDEELAEKAKKLMKDKFGFELPEIRAANPPEEPSAGSSKATSTEINTARDENNQVSTPAEGLAEVPDLADHLLAGMPGHIRDIAMRKPELIKELWTTHQNELRGRAPADPERMKRLIKEAVPPRIVATESIIPNDNDEDGESTTLLRKRPGNPKYASFR